ncbi:hypothetical protein OQA88_4657 [Cercophora sp. LCS_1]
MFAKIFTLLPLALSAFAAPTEPSTNSSVALIPYNKTVHGADGGIAPLIDSDGRALIRFCSDANGRGQCLSWKQKGHCWDFRDENLKPWNDAISSVYPANDEGVIWTLWENYNCGGQGLDVWGNVDDLRFAAINFNDKTSAFSWRLR